MPQYFSTSHSITALKNLTYKVADSKTNKTKSTLSLLFQEHWELKESSKTEKPTVSNWKTDVTIY